jgi:protein-S-isoprenylcysteine O-methyltransferase Ste14
MSGEMLRRWVFRWRGYVLVPTALLVVFFCRPTLTSFVLGLCIAMAGEGLRIWGVGYSGVTTRSSKVVAPRLVTAGPYAYVRNPLYVGNFLTALGFSVVGFGGIDWLTRLLLLGLLVASYATVYGIIIPLEEEYLERTFGASYAEYMRLVPRVLPRLKPYPQAEGSFEWRNIKHAEIHTIALFTLVFLFMCMRLVQELDVTAALLALLR